MADWIRIMMHRDVDLLKIGKIKPSEKYPPAFGAPPRIETRDIKPLPFAHDADNTVAPMPFVNQGSTVRPCISSAARGITPTAST